MYLPKRRRVGATPAGRGLFRLGVRSPCEGPADATRQPGGTDPGSKGIHGFGRKVVAMTTAATDHINIGARRYGRAFAAPVDKIPTDQHLPAPQVAGAVPLVVERAGHRVPVPRRWIEPVEIVASLAGR